MTKSQVVAITKRFAARLARNEVAGARLTEEIKQNYRRLRRNEEEADQRAAERDQQRLTA
jgi:hypothetical protein